MTRHYTNAGKALVRRDPSLAAVVAEIEVDAVRAWLESEEGPSGAALAELHGAARALHQAAERVWIRQGAVDPERDYQLLREALDRASRAIWGPIAMHPAILAALPQHFHQSFKERDACPECGPIVAAAAALRREPAEVAR